MKLEKIVSVIEMYEKLLRESNIQKKQMNIKKTFAELSKDELLSHAYFLCSGVKEYSQDPEKQRKTGSHLTAVQMCLSLAGWYTLEDLMNHNRP